MDPLDRFHICMIMANAPDKLQSGAFVWVCMKVMSADLRLLFRRW